MGVKKTMILILLSKSMRNFPSYGGLLGWGKGGTSHLLPAFIFQVDEPEK